MTYSNLATAYTLPESSRVQISVFDMHGKRVRVLQDEWQTEGTYKFNWVAKDMVAGSYTIKVSCDSGIAVNKVIFSK